MTSKFNPFNKEISKLEASDLAILREVYEGWFVDYKQDIQTKDLAKQIAAFANSNGGWLFLGIKEKDGKERTASEFPGIADIDRALRTVRDAASVHIHPQFTGYTYKVIKGPNDEIGLEEDRAIIVIEIQAALEPPYIHSSGQIYRRFDDESRPEKDRLELDKLYAKSEKFNQWFIDYYTKQSTLYSPEHPRLFLYFISDPRESFKEEQKFINFEEFRYIMKGNLDGAYVPYDSFYGSANGYIARQIFNNNLVYDVNTFEWKLMGDAFVEIPLNVIFLLETIENYIKVETGMSKTINQLTSDENSENMNIIINHFKKLWSNNKFYRPIINYTHIALSVTAAATQFFHLRQIANINSSAFIKAKLINVGHTIPFFNAPRYFENISNFGFPITRYNEIWCPSGRKFDEFLTITSDDTGSLNGTEDILISILTSVGLSDLQDDDSFYDLCKSSFSTANHNK
jgi:hypothetical protein